MPTKYPVIVVGLGATGSSALLALARRGIKGLGIDRWRPPHPNGSTHGRSRIIRQSYYESPAYVPLVRRAWDLWRQLEKESSRPLLRQTGALMLGPGDGDLIAGARQSAILHALPHEILTTSAIRKRFPQFTVRDGTVGLFEENGGALDPEACVTASLEQAARRGAVMAFDAEVTGWKEEGDAIVVHTSKGRALGERLILAAGAWMPKLLKDHPLPLSVERQLLWWFEPKKNAWRFRSRHCPVFLWEWDYGRMIYGIPDDDAGFKVAIHHEGQTVDPDKVNRVANASEALFLRRLLDGHLPDLNGTLKEGAVCLYTNTPDEDFVIGPHPASSRVTIASPCSGHGFKFASAVGDILADLVTTGQPPLDISAFSPRRFTATGRS
ncbi:MAG TPA: N-methyl-L-tryptophan oxidase [Gemmatimonadales bacterium]|nr:N-methyl-L-tryptophan oxidase [Gemmatimonadales bacterium]